MSHRPLPFPGEHASALGQEAGLLRPAVLRASEEGPTGMLFTCGCWAHVSVPGAFCMSRCLPQTDVAAGRVCSSGFVQTSRLWRRYRQEAKSKGGRPERPTIFSASGCRNSHPWIFEASLSRPVDARAAPPGGEAPPLGGEAPETGRVPRGGAPWGFSGVPGRPGREAGPSGGRGEPGTEPA